MRKDHWLTLIGLACFSSPAQGQAVTAFDVVGRMAAGISAASGALESGHAALSVVFDGQKREDCRAPQAPGATLCSVTPASDWRQARLVVQTPGYKAFSYNFQPQDVVDHRLSVGDISFKEGTLPNVEQVVTSVTNDNYEFRFVFRNKRKASALIKAIKIRASRSGEKSARCCSPIAVFRVGSTIGIRQHGAQQAVSGNYTISEGGPSWTSQLDGQLEGGGPGSPQVLALQMAAAVPIPAEDYFAVALVVPKQLKIDGGSWKLGGSAQKAPPGPAVVGHARLRMFDRLDVSFETDVVDEFPVLARVSVP